MEARLCAPAPVAALEVEHRLVAEAAGEVLVETLRGAPGAARRSLGRSRYRRPDR